MKCSVSVVVVMAVFVGVAGAQGGPQLDVAYSPPGLGAHNLRELDFYPATGGSTPPSGWPVVIWIHGGGAVTGDKDIDVALEPWVSLRAAGVAVVSINYPLAGPNYQAFLDGNPNPANPDPADDYQIHPEIPRDVALAIQFVRAQQGAWRLDPERVAVSGDSAGAFLGAQVATAADGSWLDPGITWGTSTTADILYNHRGVTNLTLPNCCLAGDAPAFGIFVADPAPPVGGFENPFWDAFKTDVSPAIQAIQPALLDQNRLLRARHVYAEPPPMGTDVHDPVNGADFQAKLESIGNVTSESEVYASNAELFANDPAVMSAWLRLQLRSRPFGLGLAASQPHPPVLALVAEGATGNLLVGNCPPNAPVVTFVGPAELPTPLPALGGFLYISLFDPLVSFSAVADAAGDALHDVDLTPVDQLGIEVFLQAFVFDDAAPEDFAISNALAVYPR